MEYIQNKLLIYDNLKADIHQNRLHIPNNDPLINPITPEWQKEKSSQLNINYENPIEQHSNIAGQKLKLYQPWLCDDIVADGNCLFRCLSKLICGNQDNYSKVRGEMCRYMITEGQETMGWYFKTHSTTPLQYLRTSEMLEDSTWGTDVELMAASALLKTDIFVATKYNLHNSFSEVRWTLIRCLENTDPTNAIYITNYSSHFEPVTRMINSISETFYTNNSNI